MAAPTSIPSNAAGPGKYSREIVLLTTLLLLLVFVIFTAFAARMYHKQYHVLGDEWFARGDQHFHSGNAVAALSDGLCANLAVQHMASKPPRVGQTKR